MAGGNAAVASRTLGECNKSKSEGEVIAPDALARRILATPKRSILAVSGISSAAIRAELDRIDTCEQRVLFLSLPSADTADGIIDKIIQVLAETALRLWPDWFGAAQFAGTASNNTERENTAKTIRDAARAFPRLLLPWALKATQLAAAERAPRVRNTNPATELAQLSLSINPVGLVLLFDCDDILSDGANSAAAVHALEWIAEHGQAAVAALFAELPPFTPPFDRILYGAVRIDAPGEIPIEKSAKSESPWIAPWRGKPHPLSDVERRLFDALCNDRELASLFTFNTLVETVLGSKPKVDLLWEHGGLVVEIDGNCHLNHTAFIGDRQRDYELLLSGYVVLRLVNEEVQQDLELALEKIRSVVRTRKSEYERTP